MFDQTQATATGIVSNGHRYQEEVEREKGNIFYATDGSQESILLADEFIFGDYDGIDAQITLSSIGISEILARKRQDFNVLFCDFSVLDAINGAIEAIKRFTKRLPDMPVFIFCNSREQYHKACSFLGEFAKNVFLKSSDNLQKFIVSEIQDFLENRNRIPVTV